MRGIVASIVFSACSGGDADPKLQGPPEPERLAALLLSPTLFAALPEVKPLFCAGLSPDEFPLRMMLHSPQELTDARLDRLRLIDGRAVLTVRVTLDTRPQQFEFWAERHEGQWCVAGWDPAPSPIADPSAPVLEEGSDPAPAVLGPIFRTSQPVMTLPILIPPAPGQTTADDLIEVRLKTVTISGDCKATDFMAAARRAEPALAACHRLALAGAPPRMGRITWQLAYAPGDPVPKVSLVETTLLLPGLTDCGTGALAVAKLEGRACQVTLPVSFTPKR